MARISHELRWRIGLAARGLLLAVPVFLAAASGTSAAKSICWTQGATQFVSAMHYCVSSVLAPQGRTTYGPGNLADGNSKTAWCEGVKGGGVGETVTIRINEGPTFRRMLIGNGYAKSRKSFTENGRVKTLRITTDTGVTTTVDLVDQAGMLPVYLPKPAQRWVRLEIADVYPGTRFADTCLHFLTPDYEYEEEQLQKRQMQK